jgi:hypothetical protein
MEITVFEAFCPLRSSLFLGVIQLVMDVIELGQNHVFVVIDAGPSASGITKVVFVSVLYLVVELWYNSWF